MSDGLPLSPELLTKKCARCSETKPAAQFSVSGGRLSSWCKPCMNEATKARKAARRAEIGEEAFLEYQRQIVARVRAKNGGVKDRAYMKARAQALKALRERHQTEFDHLLLLARRGEL